jgi:hypothetical protein
MGFTLRQKLSETLCALPYVFSLATVQVDRVQVYQDDYDDD